MPKRGSMRMHHKFVMRELKKDVSKRQARAALRRVAPWLIIPEEIRKKVSRAVKHSPSKALTKGLEDVLQLSWEVADLYEQLTSMNPGLAKAKQDGSIARSIIIQTGELNAAWKKLVETAK